jgi:exopolysaccharide biosynthesis protein
MAIARAVATDLAEATDPATASVAVTSRLAVVSTQQKRMAKQFRQQRHHASHP